MLMNEGVVMRGMATQDWDYLTTLCDPEVRRMYARRGTEGSPFSRVHMGLRQAMDTYINAYVQGSDQTAAMAERAAALGIEPFHGGR